MCGGGSLPREKLLRHRDPSLNSPTETLLFSHDVPVTRPLLLSQDFYLGPGLYQRMDRLLNEPPIGSS